DVQLAVRTTKPEEPGRCDELRRTIEATMLVQLHYRTLKGAVRNFGPLRAVVPVHRTGARIGSSARVQHPCRSRLGKRRKVVEDDILRQASRRIDPLDAVPSLHPRRAWEEAAPLVPEENVALGRR